jgi:hypothetical protein
MKRIITILILLSAVYSLKTFASDKKEKKEKKETMQYEFPDAMAQPVRNQFLVLCEKGRILYDINCAQCHNTKVNGKTVIPDFTIEQLGAYSIRVANRKHEMNVSEENVSAEDLALITTYLTYKKKNK